MLFAQFLIIFTNKSKKEDGKNKKIADLCLDCYYFIFNYTGGHSSCINAWAAREDEWFYELRGSDEPLTLANNFPGPFFRRLGFSHCLRCEQNLSIMVTPWEQVKHALPIITFIKVMHALSALLYMHYFLSFLILPTCISTVLMARYGCMKNWFTKRTGVTGRAFARPDGKVSIF